MILSPWDIAIVFAYIVGVLALGFSFVAEEKIAPLFESLRDFNTSLKDLSPVHAVVVPIEQSL